MSAEQGKDFTDDNNLKPGKILTQFQRKMLLKSLEDNLRPEYNLRIKIMLLADEGKSQTQICKTLGCSPAMARYWIVMARTGQAHNWKEQPIGRPNTVNEEYLERLKELVKQNPRDCGYSFSRWTGHWLSKHLAKELGIEVSDRHINRLLKQMGLSTRSKSSTDNNATNQTSIGSNIVIRDLQSTSEPNFPRIWPLNSIR